MAAVSFSAFALCLTPYRASEFRPMSVLKDPGGRRLLAMAPGGSRIRHLAFVRRCHDPRLTCGGVRQTRLQRRGLTAGTSRRELEPIPPSRQARDSSLINWAESDQCCAGSQGLLNCGSSSIHSPVCGSTPARTIPASETLERPDRRPSQSKQPPPRNYELQGPEDLAEGGESSGARRFRPQ